VNESTKEMVVAEDGVGIGPFSRFFPFSVFLSLLSRLKKQDTRFSGLGSLYGADKVSV
jgi:hypothetical protein